MQYQLPSGASPLNPLAAVKLGSATLFLVLSLAIFLSEPSGNAAQSIQSNPLPAIEKNIALGLDHFDAHCAKCHGASGKGDTEIGKSLGAADLTSEHTQSKSDAELFGAISNGFPEKGMPAFSKTHKPEEIWQTILFIRKLPTLTTEERKKLESAVPADARHKHDAKQEEHVHNEPKASEHKHEQTPEAARPAPQTEPAHQHETQKSASQPEAEHSPSSEHAGHEMGAAMSTVTGGPFKSIAAIGSGTSLLPATTPGHMWHRTAGDWMLMAHGNLILGFNHQGGPRGVSKAESQNWFMLMAERSAGPGCLMLRGMFSAEPWTAPRRGFPELFQTGESFQRLPIIDAQHPHDLFMELAAAFTMPLSEHVSVQLYGGPVGEPALGPVAFMHRASASENPAAPLGHHWQDSTHIAHGVFTAGLTAWRFKVEGSIFRGAEPDENRKDIEMGKLDSWSARVWFTPTPNWTLQFSRGHLTKPEALVPGNLERNTASLSYNRTWADGHWATSLIWGRNHEDHGNSNSYLLESTLNFADKNYLYGRLELADKVGLLQENIFGRRGLVPAFGPGEPHAGDPNHEHELAERWFRVGAFTFGGVRDVIASSRMRVGIGGDVTFYHLPQELKQIYGSSPASFHLYVRLRPGKMTH